MKYGFFGGTFDPIHIGHLIIAETVKELLALDKIIFIPTGNPPHKENPQIISAHHRFEMVRLATQDNSDFELSDIESKGNEISYSVNTLRILSRSIKREDIFWIIGSDSLHMMDTWREPKEIFKLSQVVVYPRLNYPAVEAPAVFTAQAIVLNATIIEISASTIREMVYKNHSIRYFVSKEVNSYIETHALYKSQE